MKINIRPFDRIIRVALGVGLIIYALNGTPPLAYWGFIGVIPLLTGLFGFCPLYRIAGLHQCPFSKGPDCHK